MKKDAIFKGAVPRDKGYKVTDAGGLHLFVSPGGGKSWRFTAALLLVYIKLGKSAACPSARMAST